MLAVFSALALIGSLPLYSQNTQPPSSAVQLAYRFAPGTAARYQISQRLTGTRWLPGASVALPIDAELTSIIRVRCVQALADGCMDLEIATEAASLKMDGKPVPSYEAPKDIRKIRITPTGKVISTGRQGEGSGQQRSPLDFGSIESIVLMAVLPDKPVDIGGTWAAELPLPFDSMSRLKLGFTLEKVESTTDGRVARIKQIMSTPINPGGSNGSATPRGSQEGRADLLFSVDRGILISAQGTTKSTVAVPVEMPESGSGEQPQKSFTAVALDSKFSVALLPVTGGARGSAVR